MLKFGINNIGKIFLGSHAIGKAYLGSNLVFQTGSTPTPTPGDLPAGYKACDWIASASNIYIDTGVTLNADYSVEIVAKIYKYANTGYYCLFGYKDSDGTQFTIRDNNNLTQIGFLHSTNAGISVEDYEHSLNRTARLDWKTYGIYKNIAKIDGTTVHTFAASTGQDSFAHTLTLLARHTAATSYDFYAFQYLKACKIWDDNDTLVRDFIPAYEEATSKFGLWDKVSGAFFTSGSSNKLLGNLRDITLPTGYTQLDFVRFTGGQSIHVSEAVHATDCFDIEWKWNATTAQQRILRVPGAAFELYINGSTKMAFNYGADAKWVSTNYVADLGHAHCKMDGYAKSLLIDSHAASKTMSLSSYTAAEDKDIFYIGGDETTANPLGQFDLYSFKKYEGNVLVHDFIPVKDTNDVYGLYDIIGQAFYPSATATPLQGGLIKD